MVRIILLAATGLGVAACAAPQTPSAAAAAAPQPSSAAAAANPQVVCKHVVAAEPGTKPYQLCLPKAEWEAKKKADARDVNRTVCRYIEHSGSIFKSYKVCMTAAEWENQRQLDRQQLERIQRGSCVPGGGC